MKPTDSYLVGWACAVPNKASLAEMLGVAGVVVVGVLGVDFMGGVFRGREFENQGACLNKIDTAKPKANSFQGVHREPLGTSSLTNQGALIARSERRDRQREAPRTTHPPYCHIRGMRIRR